MKLIDLTGKRFGRWTVVRRSERRSDSSALWDCVCDCGVERTVLGTELRYGKSQSCGCLAADNSRARARHGHTAGRKLTGVYQAWVSMRNRCSGVTDPALYADRGIGMEDPRWNVFENFLADMGDRPDGHSLDRVDNSRGYCKENCRWATPEVQNNNRRNNRRYEFNGEHLTVAELARASAVSYHTLHQRLKTGWPVERAVTAKRYESRSPT